MNGYVLGGWALSLGGLGLYSIRTILRSRSLSKHLGKRLDKS